MVHWMDLVARADEEVVTTHITKLQIGEDEFAPLFSMSIEIHNFAVPSWNRMLAMHEMSRMKLRKLIHNIVGETVSGRIPSELCLAEYENLSRPSKKRKAALPGLRKKQQFEHARLKRFLANGYEREKISVRPQEFDGLVALNFFHKRKRRIDLDNLCTKAVTDGLVGIGILPDDGPDNIVTIQHFQDVCKNEPESLLIEIDEHYGDRPFA